MRTLLILLVLVLASCSSPAPPPAPPPPPPPAPVPAPPQPLPVTVSAVDPAGARTSVGTSEPAVIAPGSTIEIRSEHALPELKVRLVDEDGRLVPSRDQVEVGQGTTYRVVPEAPLPPGTGFRLEIGPEAGGYVTDVEGKRFEPGSFELRTSGEKPPPPPRRRRRR